MRWAKTRDWVLGSKGLSGFFSLQNRETLSEFLSCIYFSKWELQQTVADQKSQLQPLSKSHFPCKQIVMLATFWHNIKST